MATGWYRPKILGLNLNTDGDYYCASLDRGARVFSINPLSEKYRIPFEVVGSIRHIEMLGKTNYMAILSGGKFPKFPDHVVLLYDAKACRFFAKLSFDYSVVSVKFSDTHLVVCTEAQLYVFSYDMNSITFVKDMCTANNPKGLCAVHASRNIMIFPAKQSNSVGHTMDGVISIVFLPDCSHAQPKLANCHDQPIDCLAMNNEGDMFATASTKGTLIRVWRLTNGHVADKPLFVCRRGTDPAAILSISFSPLSEYMLALSDKGTVHIWPLRRVGGKKGVLATAKNQIMQLATPDVELSTYQYHMSSCFVDKMEKCIATFIDNKSFALIGYDGSFHKISFKPALHGEAAGTAGELKPQRIYYDLFLELEDDF